MITGYALELLACPVCNSKVIQAGTMLLCTNKSCNSEYPINNGVLMMWPGEEQKNKLLSSRWKSAQEAEEKGAINFSEDNRRVGREFNYHVRSLFAMKCNAQSNVLEVGCGGYGIISGLDNVKCKIGIDPLMNAYIENYEVDQGSLYISGVGERLPIKDASIDVCFCNNVLDHCSGPAAIVSEIYRKLRTGGMLAIGMYCFVRKWEKSMYKLSDKLHIWHDVFHPHLYIEQEFVKLVQSTGFDVINRNDLSQKGYILGESLIGGLTEKAKTNPKLFSAGAAIYHKFIKRTPLIRSLFQAEQKYIILECIKN